MSYLPAIARASSSADCRPPFDYRKKQSDDGLYSPIQAVAFFHQFHLLEATAACQATLQAKNCFCPSIFAPVLPQIKISVALLIDFIIFSVRFEQEQATTVLA